MPRQQLGEHLGVLLNEVLLGPGKDLVRREDIAGPRTWPGNGFGENEILRVIKKNLVKKYLEMFAELLRWHTSKPGDVQISLRFLWIAGWKAKAISIPSRTRA